jgi:glycosyltransferase involved in cell wall biosynthesis
MHEMKRLLFFSTLNAPFIEEDYRILVRHCRVERIVDRGMRAIFRLPGGVLRNQVSLAWFGSVYAGSMVFLARLFKRKSMVIVAGVDASKDREINYGIWLNPWKSIFVRYAFRNADRVLVVDPFLQREVIRLAGYRGLNILNVPFGFDTTIWTPGLAKEDRVVTVASCEDESRFRKKGLDKLFEAARMLPGMQFLIIGIHKRFLATLRSRIPSNVDVMSYVSREGILPYLQRAKVYCQPSFTEGLPNALCEAMACGCIPVGTIAGGIPTAIGETGYLVPYGDVPALVRALQEAMARPSSKGMEARRRIETEFSLERRDSALARVVRELMT